MKKNQRNNSAKKPPVFVARAERAFSRVARKLRAENRKRGLSPVVWPNGGERHQGDGRIHVRAEARTRREPRTAVEKF
jgi:hypothetical protein